MATDHQIDRLISVQRDGTDFTLVLGVNPDFSPAEIDTDLGVLPDAPERFQAEHVMGLRIQRELVPTNLKAWVESMVNRFHGTRRLAEEMVHLVPDPTRPGTDLRNMQRKLQEWKQGKYTHPAGLNVDRVVLVTKEFMDVTLSVYGDWEVIEGKESKHKARYSHVMTEWFHSDPSDPDDKRRARDIVDAGGRDWVRFLEEVADREIGSPVIILQRLFGLSCQFSLV